jgi:hypothetical protein
VLEAVAEDIVSSVSAKAETEKKQKKRAKAALLIIALLILTLESGIKHLTVLYRGWMI